MPFKLVVLIFFLSCKPYAQISPSPYALLALDTSYYTLDEGITQIIRPYAKKLESEMNHVIGFCPTFLEKQKPSSALGNFMADAIYTEAKLIDEDVDFCILNYGGIRSTLDSGKITVGDIFELMPFENEIAILTISHDTLELLKQFVRKKNGEPFSRELLNIPKKDFYKVATSDYMANGGDDYAFFINTQNRFDTNLKIRDALIKHIERIETIELDHSAREL